jgi:uroporphyrinogen III methyltransferase/synthase
MPLSGDGKKGKVYLVGAGPGRADLITVLGAELLKTADCVIYDKLANPALLDYTGPNTEIIHVPKRIGSHSVLQQDINELLIEKAASGKTVVRLKGGDPCIFGRGAEEAALLAEAGIDFEIVPGVTAAIAAAEYSGIMLTHRDYSSQVVFVTGREAEGKQDSNIDWPLLAKFPGTIVFYMGIGNLEFIAEQLIKNGMKTDTPAAVIADATLPTQRTTTAPLLQIADKCRQEKIEPPAIVIIGDAADSDDRLNWFMKKPLFGKTIVVTRDQCGNADFAARITQQGGNPIQFPTIKLKPLTNSNEFLQMLAKFSEYDWFIFTSANGVTFFFDALWGLGKDCRVFASAKIATIGSETAGRLREFGIKADFVPSAFTGKELGKQLIGFANLQAKKVLLLRSELASKEIVELLTAAGAEVSEVAVYTIVPEKSESEWLTEKIGRAEIDWLTFASPSAVKSFFEQILTDLVNSSGVKVASIGPVTSEQLRSLGARVDVQAEGHTIDGLLAAIEGTYQ